MNKPSVHCRDNAGVVHDAHPLSCSETGLASLLRAHSAEAACAEMPAAEVDLAQVYLPFASIDGSIAAANACLQDCAGVG